MILVRSLRSSQSKGEPSSSADATYLVRTYNLSATSWQATPLERLIGSSWKKRPMC